MSKTTTVKPATIPSIPEFKKRRPSEREAAYIAGYRSLLAFSKEQRARLGDKRERLLAAYAEAADWSESKVEKLQSRAREE